MKKKVNILLIAIVLGLWGTVGYRFLKNRQPLIINPDMASSSNAKILSINRDTFVLKPLHRDPFLNNTRLQNTSLPRKSSFPLKNYANKVKPKAEIKLPPIPWPKIEYFGYIKSGKNEELAVVKINSQVYKLHRGESSNNGISVKKIHRDSIILTFNSQSQTYKKMIK